MGVLEKFREALNWSEEEDVYTDVLDEQEQEQEIEERFEVRNNRKSSKKVKERNNVVDLPSNGNVSVANLRPLSFEDARKVNTHLKYGRTVIVDLSDLNKAEAQRSLDFICGIVEALEAAITKIASGSIYLITPAGTDVYEDSNDEFKVKGVYPWIK